MSSYNLKGYSFKEWLKGNGKTILEVAKVGVPLAISWSQTSSPATIAIVTITGKYLLDMIHYFVKE